MLAITILLCAFALITMGYAYLRHGGFPGREDIIELSMNVGIFTLMVYGMAFWLDYRGDLWLLIDVMHIIVLIGGATGLLLIVVIRCCKYLDIDRWWRFWVYLGVIVAMLLATVVFVYYLPSFPVLGSPFQLSLFVLGATVICAYFLYRTALEILPDTQPRSRFWKTLYRWMEDR